MREPWTPQKIQEKYNRIARWYDLMMVFSEHLILRRLRQILLQRATGRVLEVAVGTGINLSFYPRACDLFAADLAPAMIRIAYHRARNLGRVVRVAVMNAEELAFPDRSFDTVVCTLSLCTIPDPVRALREMARVCKPDGRILLMERGRSEQEWIGRLQDRWTPYYIRFLGSHLNRRPLEMVQAVGLRVVDCRRYIFGIYTVMEAQP